MGRDSITVVAYYFGNYHPTDPRNQALKGKDWTEWDLVKAAKPLFPGHQQPKVPLWGYGDESDPRVMAQKIDAAADHCIDVFLFDWYHYNDGPFLERSLEEGYFKAPNNRLVKFALMWANHDWVDIHPYHAGAPPQLLYPGVVTPTNFEFITALIVDRYLSHPSYWRIDGKPYFSFYDLTNLLAGFGCVEATRQALDAFRAKAVKAGLPGLHLNAVVWGKPILPLEKTAADPPALVRDLGFDSVTSYVWVHDAKLPDLQTDYVQVRDQYLSYWDRAEQLFSIPYYPNVTLGWDGTPRNYGGLGMPNTISGNTPDRIREALEITRRRLAARADHKDRIFNINCWNEWTEGSYLEPDTVFGMAYLEAVRDVFR